MSKWWPWPRREMSKRERLASQLTRAGIVLSLLLLVAALVIFADDNLALVPLTFGVAFAAAGVGGIFGFLFGIPKMDGESPAQGNVANGDPTKAAPPGVVTAQRLLHNTNLGQVSDWVTKIVIGLGIAQFGEILDGAAWLGDWYATVFAAGLSPSAAATYGLAVTISAATLSLMLAYLWTMTRLPEVWQDFGDENEDTEPDQADGPPTAVVPDAA